MSPFENGTAYIIVFNTIWTQNTKSLYYTDLARRADLFAFPGLDFPQVELQLLAF